MARAQLSESEAMFQAAETASFYLDRAVDAIGCRFGKDYPVKHPELVAAYMRIASRDYSDWVASEISRREQDDRSEWLTCLCEQAQEAMKLIDHLHP